MAEPRKRPLSRAVAPDARALLVAAVIVAICYFAREVLLPLTLAVLLSFLLAPLAKRFQRWGLGRIGSVILAVGMAFATLGMTGWIVTRQVLELAQNLPQYEERLIERIRSLRRTGSNALSEAAETVEHIEEELASDAEPPAGNDVPETPAETPTEDLTGAGQLRTMFAALNRPLPVQIIDTTLLPVRIFRDASPMLAPVGSLAITVVFVIFMLLEREDLRDRLIRLAGTSRVYMTTEALDDAARRVSRYLRMQLIINGIYGVSIGIGLSLIGLPNAVLWGLLATLLRFLPYVGPMVASLTPIALSLAVFEGWMNPILTVSLFVTLELITNNVLEPWLYGASTGVSTLGIIVAAVFWTWLWGPVGLVLATPLTVCVTVLARHVPQLSFLNILLADEPPLEPKVRFYQRLLAQDFDEAADVVGEFLKQSTSTALGDTILIPALVLAERDRDSGRLSENRENFVYESITEIVGDFTDPLPDDDGDPATDEATNVEDGPRTASKQPGRRPLRVLCVAAEDDADRVAALVLARLLELKGYDASVCNTIQPGDASLGELEKTEIDCIVISTIAPSRGTIQARRLCLNLHRRFPRVKLLVGLWRSTDNMVRARDRLQKTGADAVAVSLEGALQQIDRWDQDRLMPSERDESSAHA